MVVDFGGEAVGAAHDKHQALASACHTALKPLAEVYRGALGTVFVKQNNVVAGFECSEQSFALGCLLLGFAHVAGIADIPNVQDVEGHIVLQPLNVFLDALTDKSHFGFADDGECNLHFGRFELIFRHKISKSTEFSLLLYSIKSLNKENNMKTREELIDELIDLAFAEDIGDGDATTLCCIPADEMGRQRLIVKEEGILAGVEIARRVFEKFDPELQMEVMIEDGAHVKPGDIAFVVTGKVRSLLQTERLMLNIMQRMSGVATTTARYAKCLEGLKTRVLDTRKTTPGMRILEKDAVKIGGGCNHRIGLFDMILLKDNHVDFAGGIVPAIEKAHQWCKDNGKDLKIEIEVRNFDELQQVLEHGGVDRVMLDNFSVENTRKAVEIINGRVETESSGGITIDTLRAYGECGVDYISVGALTHSIKSLDMSFKAC